VGRTAESQPVGALTVKGPGVQGSSVTGSDVEGLGVQELGVSALSVPKSDNGGPNEGGPGGHQGVPGDPRGVRTPPLLELRDVEVGYREVGRESLTIAGPLHLPVERGEFICLLGPNGSGKSTLLRTISNSQAALAGAVLMDGEPLDGIKRRELARRIAVVLTDPLQSWALTGHELVALGRLPHVSWTGRLTAADEAAVRDALLRARATELASRPVQELSDGERQRVLLARALAQQACLLLLDEITAFLDLPHRLEVMRLLAELVAAREHSVILSTHDLELALRTADRIWLLPGDGRLVDGAPEDLVLSGDIHRAFARFGVRFDPELGHFDWEVPERGAVGLAGDGLHAWWTERALRRQGFRVERVRSGGGGEGGATPVPPATSAPPPTLAPLATVATVSVMEERRWTVEQAGAVLECASIAEMIRALRRAGQARDPA